MVGVPPNKNTLRQFDNKLKITDDITNPNLGVASKITKGILKNG